jgi:peptide chain release factor 2
MQPIIKQLQDLGVRIKLAMERLDIASDEAELAKLDRQIADPDFWNDSQSAAATSQRAAALRARVSSWTDLQKDAGVALELAQLGDDAMVPELEQNLRRLEEQYAAKEFELKLSGPYDKNGTILTIAAGAGGTDAQDWAEMLLRMYLRYAERSGFNAEIIDRS